MAGRAFDQCRQVEIEPASAALTAKHVDALSRDPTEFLLADLDALRG
jgi:hypothetical protein